MTEPQDTTSQEQIGGDPANTDIEQLTAALDPDDDVAERVELCTIQYPELLETAGAVGEEPAGANPNG